MSSESTSAAYLVILGLCFFAWPVVAGISGVAARLLWIAGAAIAACCSARALSRALAGEPPLRVPWSPAAIAVGLLLSVILLTYSALFPPLAFSDELTIATPARMVVTRMASVLPLPFLVALAGTAAVGLFVALRRAPRRAAALTVALCLLLALGIALSGIQSGLALRYPPIVHLVQLALSLVTGNHSALIRAPSVLWTVLLLAFCFAAAPPAWSRTARLAIAAGLTLGPLGWTYRIVLYQAGGETALGLLAVLLLWRSICKNSEGRAFGGWLGALFALWFLYRPTAIAPFAATIGILLLARRWPALRATSSVAVPVIAVWLLLSPLYTASYGWERQPIFAILRTVLGALPENFHPLGLTVLLGSSAAALALGARAERFLVAIAWIIGLSAAGLQQWLAGPVFTGVARYNILLLLPLGCSLGCLVANSARRRLARAIATIGVLVLLAITPVCITTYLQTLRATAGERIWFTPSEGYDPLPVIAAVRALLTEYGDTLVLLAPQYGFLDTFVVEGMLTPAQRDAIVMRSAAWTASSPARPVVVQAPVVTSYRPNITEEMESRLRDAREWALKQEHHRVAFGIEETLIVR